MVLLDLKPRSVTVPGPPFFLSCCKLWRLMSSIPTPYASPGLGSQLLDLPNELVCMVLSVLGFQDQVRASNTCQRLRQVASDDCRLWQDLPVVTVEDISGLETFAFRPGSRGFDLILRDVWQLDSPYLELFLRKHLAKVRFLHIAFRPVDEHHSLDDAAMILLWDALGNPAPFMRRLELISDDDVYREFLSPLCSLSPNILGGVRCTGLRDLKLTAFSLDTPCVAFSDVNRAFTTVASLAPRVQQTSLTAPNPQWDNFDLETHFPALTRLELSAIMPDFDDLSAATCFSLRRIPFLLKPLESLLMIWSLSEDLQSEVAQDEHDLFWLERSMQHVGRLMVECVDCPSICQPYSPLSFTARCISVMPHGEEDIVYLAVCTAAPEIFRAVRVPAAQVRDRLGHMLTAQCVDTLYFSTDPHCLVHLDLAWGNLPNLRTLSIIIDWDSVFCEVRGDCFISQSNLEALAAIISCCGDTYQRSASATPGSVDARNILDFARRVTPDVKRIEIRGGNVPRL